MSEEIKQFNINIKDIKEDNNLFNNIQEAIDKLRIHTLADRFEVVLNNNLIEIKEKLTNYRTILGCRITYDNLDRNISFIVREDNTPTYEELEDKIDKQKEVLDKIKDDLIKTKKYNKAHEDKYGNKLINIDIDHLDYLLKILEEIE